MSKSDPSNLSRINLTDGPDDIAQKIRKARTDSEPLPSEAAGLEGRPEAENLVGIYAALSNLDLDSVLSDVGGIMFADFKARLIDKAIAVLGPMGLEMQLLLDDTDYIDSVLADGGTRARAITQPILDDLYDLIGLAR
jgi:tryptophanyl-tRNA synthetase